MNQIEIFELPNPDRGHKAYNAQWDKCRRTKAPFFVIKKRSKKSFLTLDLLPSRRLLTKEAVERVRSYAMELWNKPKSRGGWLGYGQERVDGHGLEWAMIQKIAEALRLELESPQGTVPNGAYSHEACWEPSHAS